MASSRPRVYFDITVGSKPAGRIVMELFTDTTPLMAENFRALCTGEKGLGKSGKPLHYKGSTFYTVIPGWYCAGGDIYGDALEDRKGQGQYSSYESQFNKERSISKHNEAGILSMVFPSLSNYCCKFIIYQKECPECDGKYVAFGRVIQGLEVTKAMEKLKRDAITQKLEPVVIADCGELSQLRIHRMSLGFSSPGGKLEQVIPNYEKQLKDSLERCREEFELLTAKATARDIDQRKVKDLSDVRKDLRELVKVENNLKSHMEVVKKEMSMWEEDCNSRLSSLQKKIISKENNIVVLEAIQSVPYEDLADIANAIMKRMNVGQ